MYPYEALKYSVKVFILFVPQSMDNASEIKQVR